MRAFSYWCLLPVTYKDGDHAILFAVAEILCRTHPHTSLHFTSVLQTQSYWWWNFHTAGIRICFRCKCTGWLWTFFAPVTLTFFRWPSCTNLIGTPWRMEIHWICKYKFRTSRLSKVYHLTDRDTDRQTELNKIINRAAFCGWSIVDANFGFCHW